MDLRCAAAVRQILFESQKGYTYDSSCIPKRIELIRNVIMDIDGQIEKTIVVSD